MFLTGRFAFIFLGIWWSLNVITFHSILALFQRSSMDNEFEYIQQLIGFVYLNSAFFGTIVILLAVRGIVKPIKKISKAAKEVAGDNLDVQVDIKSHDERKWAGSFHRDEDTGAGSPVFSSA